SDTLFLSPGKLATVVITLDPAIGPTPNQPPNPPSNPHPPDGATEQPLNVVLSWSCSDPDSGDVLTFDVYFGSDSIPPLVSSTQSETTYDPPENLEQNQTYYWKIVAMDGHYEQTVSPIWSFGTAPDSVVVFADPNLEQAVRNWIGKPIGDILVSDVDTITYFWAESEYIQSLEGLEYFVSLNYLLLPFNEISDITPLQNLTQLYSLDLFSNQISDITSLQNLAQLTWLDLELNQISDLTPLENLTELTWLRLRANQIAEIDRLQNLTQLTGLFLGDNQISDITPLQNLTQLMWLDLGYNQIEDILPLVNNSGMDDGDEVWLGENPLSETSINEYIPQLEARGVTVYY
ncbi:MAG: leucine-rich repeat domain-containing protein, partial [Candidatus Zixiibacteriota bacterium]